MRFFQAVLSGAALVAAAWAVELNDVPTALEAGKSYTITYSPKDNTPTTFILRKGDPENLEVLGPIGTATGGSFTWTVPSDLVDAPNYAFEVQQEGAEPNYSGLIPLTGGSGEEDSSSSSSASDSASSSGYPTASGSSTPSVSATTTESTTKTVPVVTAPASSTGYMTMPGTNSTITSATLSRTTSTSDSSDSTDSPSATNSSPPVEQSGAAAVFGSSPLALFVGAAAMVYFN